MFWLKTALFIILIIAVIFFQTVLGAMMLPLNLIACSVLLAVILRPTNKWLFIFVISLVADFLYGTFAFHFLGLSLLALIATWLLKRFSNNNLIAAFFWFFACSIIYSFINIPAAWLNGYFFSRSLPYDFLILGFGNWIKYLLMNSILAVLLFSAIKKIAIKVNYA